MRCDAIREELTALADGALSPGGAAELRTHLSGCASCEAERQAIEHTSQLTRTALAELPALRPGFETRLRQQLAEADAGASRAPWWRWTWRPLLIGGMATVAVLVAAGPLGGPTAVLVPLGIKAPPPKVAKQPELFRDYAIIEHLDELENFDTVETVPLEDEIQGDARDQG